MNNLKRESFSFAGNMKEKLFISQALEKMQGFTVGMTNCRELRRAEVFLCIYRTKVSVQRGSGMSWKDGRGNLPTLWCPGAGLSSSWNITEGAAAFQYLTNQA